MHAHNKTSHVVLELSNSTPCEIWGLKTLSKSKVFKLRYGARAAYVYQRLFVSRKNEARELLADHGIVITSNTDWNEILKGIDEVVHFKEDLLIEHPGWTKEYFAQPNGKVYAPAGRPNPRVMFERSREVAACKGTYKGWREQIAVPLTAQTIPMLAILAGLAGPMLRFSGENLNFGFEFSGPPETGKSTCLAIMASTTGRPDSLTNFNVTLAGLEDMFSAHNDSPFPVNEANLAERSDGKFMKDFAFRLAEGKIKVTRFHSGRAHYRFVYGTSANTAFHTKLRAYDPDDANGAFQRLLPIRIEKHDDGRGVFDFLPDGFDTFGALADHLNGTMERQHGTPMRRLLQCLVDARARDEEGLKAQIQRKIHAFEMAVGVAGTKRGKTRASTHFGILYAAGCFAKLSGVLPADWDCLSACLAAYRNYQSQLPAQTPLVARLNTIARRPDTFDLRTGKLPTLSDAEVERHGAFLHLGKGKRLELLITEALMHRYFPDLATIKHTAEFQAINLRDREHSTKQRTIRRGPGKERVFCFVLPSALTDGL
jgi:hypothetical protein